MDPSRRIPTIYDSAGLKKQIERLADELLNARTKPFYVTTPLDGELCQGDVVFLDATAPFLDDTGEADGGDRVEHWLVLGNTCDFTNADVEWTQLVPLTDLDASPPEAVTNLRQCKHGRKFYLPVWQGAQSSAGYAVDFLRPVTVSKQAFSTGPGRVVARLTDLAWALLHSCIIRFFARDDGRHDPT